MVPMTRKWNCGTAGLVAKIGAFYEPGLNGIMSLFQWYSGSSASVQRGLVDGTNGDGMVAREGWPDRRPILI